MPRVSVLRKERPFIVFGKPDISGEEIRAVTQVLQSGWIGTGKVTRQFEAEFRDYLGDDPDRNYCVSCSSASMGLILALKAAGVKEGDEVITTPLTFVATANAILSVGAHVVFADVDQYGCLDPYEVLPRINKKTKAIIPVHYTGFPCQMDRFIEIGKCHNIKIIEDAAHSFNGTYQSKKQGTFGDFGVFSFYATKNITCGEGGMVVCKHEVDAQKVRLLAMQGQSSGAWDRYTSGPISEYKVLEHGFKGNLPDILATIGLVQLRRRRDLKAKRAKVFRIYEDAFGFKGHDHSHHLYTIAVKNRFELRKKLYDAGIGTGVHYEALHLEPAFRYLNKRRGLYPMAEKIADMTLSLPVSNSMTVDDAHYVVEKVHEYN